MVLLEILFVKFKKYELLLKDNVKKGQEMKFNKEMKKIQKINIYGKEMWCYYHQKIKDFLFNLI